MVVRNSRWLPLFSTDIEGPVDYAFIGGAYYVKGKKVFNIKEIKDISLMPSFCHTRIFPQELEKDDWIHSCIYVQMPLFCYQKGDSSVGFSFSPYIKDER
ncbi:MAG: hypothetical protein DRI36_01675, partial [Caldiserica bacterium]